MARYLFILGQESNEAATRCFQFAKVAADKGHQVDLFMIDGGVEWANSKRDFSLKTITGDSPNDYLPTLVEREIPIGVWIPCAKSRQVDESQFFSNMYLGGAPAIIEISSEAKVFNF